MHGVHILRCATKFVRDSKDISEIEKISLYRKYNRLSDGNLRESDLAPDIGSMTTLNGSQVSLFSILPNTTTPLILIPGSIT